MRALLQRVTKGKVLIKNQAKGEVGLGYLVFLGVKEGDSICIWGRFLNSHIIDKINEYDILFSCV